MRSSEAEQQHTNPNNLLKNANVSRVCAQALLHQEAYLLVKVLGWVMFVLGIPLLALHVLGEAGWVFVPDYTYSIGPINLKPFLILPEFSYVVDASAPDKWTWGDRMIALFMMSDLSALVAACVFGVFSLRASRMHRRIGRRYGIPPYRLGVLVAILSPLLVLSFYFPVMLGLFLAVLAWRIRLRAIALAGLLSGVAYLALVFFVPAGFAFLASGLTLLGAGFLSRDVFGESN